VFGWVANGGGKGRVELSEHEETRARSCTDTVSIYRRMCWSMSGLNDKFGAPR
jgi:hypothetical protein